MGKMSREKGICCRRRMRDNAHLLIAIHRLIQAQEQEGVLLLRKETIPNKAISNSCTPFLHSFPLWSCCFLSLLFSSYRNWKIYIRGCNLCDGEEEIVGNGRRRTVTAADVQINEAFLQRRRRINALLLILHCILSMSFLPLTVSSGLEHRKFISACRMSAIMRASWWRSLKILSAKLITGPLSCKCTQTRLEATSC